MQMSINFKKLFNLQQPGSSTPSTTSLQNSYHFDQPSIISYTGSMNNNNNNNMNNNSVDIYYKFDGGLFFDSFEDQILGELDDDDNGLQYNRKGDQRRFEQKKQYKKQYTNRQHQQQSNIQQKQKNLTKSSYTQFCNQPLYTNNFKDPSTITTSTISTSKPPGQRLYYQHKIQHQRKLKQLQRIKLQLQQKQSKQITFKPVLNEKSKRILQLADSPLRRLENMKKSQKKKQEMQQLMNKNNNSSCSQFKVKSTLQRKQQQQLRNCTFKPVILKTPLSLIPSSVTNNSSNKNLSSVFESLYNQHRAKLQRRRQILQEQQQFKKGRTMGKQQLQQFFNKNKQYLQQKKHREELLKAVSSQYDLTSGRKLFHPKINVNVNSNTGGSVAMVRFANEKQQNNTVNDCNNKNKNRKVKSIVNNKKLSSQSKQKQHQNNKSMAVKKPIPYQMKRFISEVVNEDIDNDQDNNVYQQQYLNTNQQIIPQQVQQRNFIYGNSIKSNIFSIKAPIIINNNKQQQNEQQQYQQQPSMYNINLNSNNNSNKNINLINQNRQQQQQQHNNGQVEYQQPIQRLFVRHYGSDSSDDDNDQQQQKQFQQQQKQFEQQYENQHNNKQQYHYDEQQQQQQQLQLDYEQQHEHQLQQNNYNLNSQQQQLRQSVQKIQDTVTKRANFLQSIVTNPIYTQKYNDLLLLGQQQYKQQLLVKQQQQHKQQLKQQYQTQQQHDQQQTCIQNSDEVIGKQINSVNSNIQPTIDVTSIQNDNIITPAPIITTTTDNTTNIVTQILPNPVIVLSQDSQQQQQQQSSVKKLQQSQQQHQHQQPLAIKSWQQIFNSTSTATIQPATLINNNNKTIYSSNHNNLSQQSRLTQRSRLSEKKQLSSNKQDDLLQSPKKKPINIASLLKAKKKLSIKV